MSDHLRRLIALCVVLSLVWAGTSQHTVPVRAQDDGGTVQYNDPYIATLPTGQNVTLTFSVLAGDSFELVLSRLAEYTYTAVLIDPDQNATPLTPDPDGNTTFSMDSATVGGTYALVLQASAGSGDMLVQLNSDAVEPVPLIMGRTPVDLLETALRFDLAPSPDTGPTILALEAGGEGGMPAFSLVNKETGETILEGMASNLPLVSITLPAQATYLLLLESGETQITVAWSEAPPSSEDTAATDSSSGATSSSSSSSSGSSGGASTSGACQIFFSSNVNVRSGPGLAYDPPIGQAAGGTTLPVTGTNQNRSWWQVTYNGQPGWVSGQVAATQTQGDCSAVSVASYPAPPSGSGGQAGASPTYTYTPGGPTPTYTYTPGGPTPTYTYTYTPSPSYTPGGPTPTYTYTSTPTTNAPTATYTPSYTPTTPPAAQVAPPDANFNAPLNLPLDNTASVLDFVSYPGGDSEDRVRWDITGMNPNSSQSGGRARLVLAVSCFGTGIENVQFFTGGSTYGCGQTIVDREVTYDSRTGQVTITAVGGDSTYVQWVLTGTATRIN